MRLAIGFILGLTFQLAVFGYTIADRADECALSRGIDRCQLAFVPVAEGEQ